MQLSLSGGTLLNAAQLVWGFWGLQSLLSRVFHIATWDGLSRLSALWDILSSIQSLWLVRSTLGWLVLPVVGYPLLGIHPSVSIVKLTMIGYHCNCLEGPLNYRASAHWLIGVTVMYHSCDWWLCHSTPVSGCSCWYQFSIVYINLRCFAIWALNY